MFGLWVWGAWTVLFFFFWVVKTDTGVQQFDNWRWTPCSREEGGRWCKKGERSIRWEIEGSKRGFTWKALMMPPLNSLHLFSLLLSLVVALAIKRAPPPNMLPSFGVASCITECKKSQCFKNFETCLLVQERWETQRWEFLHTSWHSVQINKRAKDTKLHIFAWLQRFCDTQS